MIFIEKEITLIEINPQLLQMMTAPFSFHLYLVLKNNEVIKISSSSTPLDLEKRNIIFTCLQDGGKILIQSNQTKTFSHYMEKFTFKKSLFTDQKILKYKIKIQKENNIINIDKNNSIEKIMIDFLNTKNIDGLIFQTQKYLDQKKSTIDKDIFTFFNDFLVFEENKQQSLIEGVIYLILKSTIENETNDNSLLQSLGIIFNKLGQSQTIENKFSFNPDYLSYLGFNQQYLNSFNIDYWSINSKILYQITMSLCKYMQISSFNWKNFKLFYQKHNFSLIKKIEHDKIFEKLEEILSYNKEHDLEFKKSS